MLYYELGKIKNWEEACFDGGGEMRPRTENLIYSCLLVDMQGITSKNIEEFKYRVRQHQKKAGQLLQITDADIEEHVGLWTSCSKRSRREWKKHLDRIVEGLEGKKVRGGNNGKEKL